MSNAFARATMMFAAIAAAMDIQNVAEQRTAMAGIGPYRSRGHGRGGWPHSNHFVAQDKRAAVKARNVKRHKAAARRAH